MKYCIISGNIALILTIFQYFCLKAMETQIFRRKKIVVYSNA